MNRNILNYDAIKYFITNNGDDGKVPYRWTHGATDYHLGDGLIVYALIQFYKTKTCVCLGSGGGFIPRIMSQSRQDLHKDGTFSGDDKYDYGDIGSTYIVDAMNGINGKVDWEDKDSFLNINFWPQVIKETTENAYHNYFVKREIKIDYLHIDANHTFDGVKKDFELYSKIVNKNGIISIHDTDKNYVDNFAEVERHKGDDLTGPSDFIKTIDNSKYEVFNFFNHGIDNDKPSSTGLTIVRKK